MSSIRYETPVETLSGEKRDLGEYRGRVLLVVNTASKCGFTPQYAGLEALHETYRDRGLSILGFPCNQFGRQEPGTEEEIGAFCQRNYGVSFPTHAKVEVNGPGTHPLSEQLKDGAPGLVGSRAVKWNFTKFLVDRRGRVVERFAPSTPPAKLASRIEELLEESDA